MSDTKYARDLAVESCRRIAEGESLRSVCMLGVFAEFERKAVCLAMWVQDYRGL